MLLVVLVSMFFFSPNTPGEEIAGQVISVVDGNTFELLSGEDEVYKIMLFGIDCPESGQPFAEAAKDQLEKLLLKKKVVVKILGKDRWGTRMGTVEINDTDPRHLLLQNGLAWTTEREPLENLEVLRKEAIQNQKGLWAEQEPIPPWIYRREQSMLQPKSR